jgi:hypothetical protein
LPILAELIGAQDTLLKTIVETIDVSDKNESIRKTANIRGHFYNYGEKKANFTTKIDLYAELSY